MPGLIEDMYCSQQIGIPPTFPYLLRQYAKAAIRTQPTDLLRWSTAYFRCLALNLPLPVKPRLEYPIAKTHYGLTPGWLKALMCQLQNNLTVSFKILWDRWIGACLQHQNLIEILCLGGFTDHLAIPWIRFVALCAAHLADNLTKSMIIICEILTEEPEGGSAMIPLETFVDVYKFLANIDASQPRIIENVSFTDSLLTLYCEPEVIIAKESVSEIEEEVEEEEVVEEEEEEEVIEEGPVEDLTGVVISCPDIAMDDYKTEEDFLNQQEDEKEVPEEEIEVEEVISKIESTTEIAPTVPLTFPKPNFIPAESVDTLVNYMPPRLMNDEMDSVEEHIHIIEPENMGEEEETEETDSELEKLKRILEQAPDAPQLPVSTELILSKESEEVKEESEEVKEESEEEIEPIKEKELISLEAIPGIGAIIPNHLVEAVIKYMNKCATYQHGMVMPRNIRHFSCPPLEVLE